MGGGVGGEREMESVCKQETHVLMREMLSPYCKAREGQKHSNL